MNKIKEFWLTRKEAKSKLREASKILDEYTRVIGKIKKAKESLEEIYRYLPPNQRRDYIQKSLDLLSYGFVYEYSSSGDTIVRILREISYTLLINNLVFDLRESYEKMKSLVGSWEYKESIEEYREFINILENYEEYINKF